MPEVHIRMRWPDGAEHLCTSPSTAIEKHLAPGASYPLPEFLRRARSGLQAASDRVRETYGYACTSAAAELQAIEARAAALSSREGARVEVTAMKADRSRRQRPRRAAAVTGHHEAIVIGGGQAGLSVSWHLREQGIEHLVLERDTVACSWREQRWDAFCLVTPNWQCTLPGHHLTGVDPDGFILRDEIVAYVEAYAEGAPVVEGVTVTAVTAGAEGGFVVATSEGTCTADQVVLAVGGYHVPSVPRLADGIPASVTQLHSSTYRNPESLPDGEVLIVGTGQSGAQIAEDLHRAGRTVHLAVGTAPRVARFYRGRDVVAWLEDIGRYDLSIDEHPEGEGARKEANHYVTGRDGGHDIDLRVFASEGAVLHGRLTDARGGVLHFAGDLAANLDGADATYERINRGIDAWIEAQGIDAPPVTTYEPVWVPTEDGSGELDLVASGVTTVIWATGFRSNWSWVRLPAFDGAGYPTHHRGVTTVDGLYVVGLPWLHTWGSGRFAGIARDAEHLVGRLAERMPSRAEARAAA